MSGMTPEQHSQIREKRIAEARATVAAWDGQSGQWFWISFADEKGFRGVCIVRAPTPTAAPLIAHSLACNPGGEAQFIGISEEKWREVESLVYPDYTNRLLSREEADNLNEKIREFLA
jgi:hypothetical protein